MEPQDLINYLRAETIGRDRVIRTPFGDRLLHYFDWTASGRGLRLVEEYLRETVLPDYANTHTEDDATGRATTLRLRAAEQILKDAVHAGPEYHLVHCGSGTTEAIHRLMQILGIYVPPLLASRCRTQGPCAEDLPLVVIGPYEHHSNVIPWREGLCQVEEIPPNRRGEIDLEVLDAVLADSRWEGRRKIGCFSAASNVTGLRTATRAVAQVLHRHHALACFDWAAAAPYEEIDVRGRDGDEQDAVFFSPHKFLGGPGSSGVLVFHQRIYRCDLPPTFGGGGTVAYVGPRDHDFLASIEEREKPGTPGILQAMRAALAVQVRERIGAACIREIEDRHLRRVLPRWAADPRMDVLGDPDPSRRIGVVSFNIRHGAFYLHPRFVTRLLSDLFGVQTRAGCSCAGPYGHRLLGIDEPTSAHYRSAIRQGSEAVKPGWVRVNLHYTMDDEEVDHLLDCVEFVAEHGARFLALYECGLGSGTWAASGWQDPPVSFGLAELPRPEAERAGAAAPLDDATRRRLRKEALDSARELAARLPPARTWIRLPAGLGG